MLTYMLLSWGQNAVQVGGQTTDGIEKSEAQEMRRTYAYSTD